MNQRPADASVHRGIESRVFADPGERVPDGGAEWITDVRCLLLIPAPGLSEVVLGGRRETDSPAHSS